MHNPENFLPRGARLFAAFFGPPHRPLDSRAQFARRARVGRAVVKDHGDVRTERALDFHRLLWAEEQKRAIEMGTELDAVRLDFSDRGQAEDLEAAAIGEDRALPIDELVQAARGADDFETGPNVEVVSVTKDDLRAHFVELPRVEGFHAALRANRHEHGRVHHAVGGRQPAQAGFGTGVAFQQLEHCRQG